MGIRRTTCAPATGNAWERNADVGFSVAYRLHHTVGAHRLHVIGDVRKPVAKNAHGVKQRPRNDSLDAADAQMTALEALQGVDLELRVVTLGEHPLRVAKIDLSGRRQAHAPCMPFEQRSARIFFEDLDMAADGGGGYVQPLRCTPDRPGAGHLDEVTQRIKHDTVRLFEL